MKLPNGVVVCLEYIDDSSGYNHIEVQKITESIQYIGALDAGMTTHDVGINVKVDPTVVNRIFGIAIDHKHGTVQLKRDLAKDPVLGLMVPAGGKHYQTKVRVRDSKNFIPVTDYPQNYMALVEIDHDKPGLVRIWEVALVSQKGLFFVATQCTYEVQCYLDGSIFKCPFFQTVKPAPMFVELFFKLFTLELAEKLPPLSEYVPPSDPPQPWSDHGTVLWWNCAMGWGVIQTTAGVARVHWSNVKDVQGLAHLNAGDIVTYEELAPPFQTNENHETAFKLEAFGVRKVTLGSSVSESSAEQPTSV